MTSGPRLSATAGDGGMLRGPVGLLARPLARLRVRLGQKLRWPAGLRWRRTRARQAGQARRAGPRG
jgi:hypothetical protein